MATLRDIRRRIRAVRSMEQITRAMEMVSAAKLRRAQARVVAARPYARAMDAMLENLSATAAEIGHPLFTPRPVRRRLLVVIGADRGLSGSYSANLTRGAEALLRSPEGADVELFLLGRKLRDHFKRRPWTVREALTDLPPEARLDTAQRLTAQLQGLYLGGAVDAVDLMYTQFVSLLTRRLVREPFLPIAARRGGARGPARRTIFEPAEPQLLAELLPRYAATKLLQAIAESLASEHAARMVAMSAASKNAGEVIDALVLQRNRLRQAGITKELAEIVGGAQPLV